MEDEIIDKTMAISSLKVIQHRDKQGLHTQSLLYIQAVVSIPSMSLGLTAAGGLLTSIT